MADGETHQEDLGAQAARLIQLMNANPKARAHLEAGVKELDPRLKTTNEQITELLEPHLAPVRELAEQMKADREAQTQRQKDAEEAAAVAQMESTLNRLQLPKAQGGEGLTADGIEEVKKLMVERNIADPDAAYALFQRQHPAVSVEEPGYVPARWNFEKNAVDDDIEGLFRDPDGWADRKVGEVLTDIRSNAARAA